MHYVYILQSSSAPDRFYVGCTEDLKERLKIHNRGKITHTSRCIPWALKTYIGFSDKQQAINFEKYLKTASGRAFAKKRL